MQKPRDQNMHSVLRGFGKVNTANYFISFELALQIIQCRVLPVYFVHITFE